MRKQKRSKFGLGILMALIVILFITNLAAGESWSQINQPLARDNEWKHIVSDHDKFQLGESIPLAGEDSIYISEWGSYPSMDGSTVCVPLAMELGRQWLSLSDEDLNGFVNFSTTPNAYDRLAQRNPNPMATIPSKGIIMDDKHPIDIVIGTYPNADERKAAKDAGMELVSIPICYDAFVFLVNGQNPINSLTATQIRGIYSGGYRFWSEVGGEKDVDIVAYQRPHGSGSQTAMEELVMDGYQLSAADPNYVSIDMGGMISQIGNYQNTKGAIGYSYLYYVERLYKSGKVKVLGVDDVMPVDRNLQNESYPFTVNYYATYEKGNALAEEFVEWMISDEGQLCIAQAGYVPLRELAK